MSRKQESEETEANIFAMELLMPTKMLEEDCKDITFDVESSKEIEKLAKRYAVSAQLMTIRLGQLGYLGKS